MAALVEVALIATDTSGNPISSIPEGSDFQLRATVRDLRPSPEGVFASYVDVTYDATKAAVDGPITYGPNYPNGHDGDTSTPGLIDEVGAFDNFGPLGGSAHLLFVVPFTATAAGTLNFTLDPADEVGHETLLFGFSGGMVDPADIVFVGDSLEIEAAAQPQVQVKLTATDLMGNPIDTITEGSDFLLKATVQDIRPAPQGVFAAYVDVNYDASRAAVDGAITYGPNYPNGREGDTSTPGLIDEVGAFDGFFPLGGSEQVLFVVPMTATGAGTLNFTLDPADESPGHDVLVFGMNGAVDPADILFVGDSLEVESAGPKVEIKLTVTDLMGNPIDTITAGSDFLVQATVEDLRSVPQGVFAAYADVTYDAAKAAVDGAITYGPDYPNGQDGDTSTPGLIDEVGAFDGFFPLGGGEHVLFVIPMTATSLGTLEFVLDPADESPGHDVLIFGSNDPVPASAISFVNDSIEVLPAANTVVVADGVLHITGGAAADTVTISQNASQVTVTASFLPGGLATFPTGGVTSIVVDVSGANDTVVVAPSVTKPTQIDAGAGNDTIVAGGATSLVLGGDGNDTITAGTGRNVIIGGAGADTILASGGDDLLIAGTTSFDQNDAALNLIVAEWNSSRTYAERVDNLRAGSGPVLGGTGVSLEKGVTVFDDASADILSGGADSDWFLYDLALDLVLDKSLAEAAN